MAFAKDVQVNKFRVKYDGAYYGPGQAAGNIIYDMPVEMADSLISGSNGTVVEIPKRGNAENRFKKKESRAEVEPDAGLPGVDPGATVKK